MKNKIFIYCLLLSITITYLLFLNVSAAPQLSYHIKTTDPNVVVIDGNGLDKSQNLVLQILYPNKSINDLSSDNSNKDEIIYQLALIKADEKGQFTYSNKIPGSLCSGVYTLRMGYMLKMIEMPMKIINPVERETALQEVKTAMSNNSYTQLKSAVVENIVALDFDISLYNNLSSPDTVFNRMLDSKADLSNYDNLKYEFYLQVVLESYNNASPSQVLSLLSQEFDTYSPYYNLVGFKNSQLYTLYQQNGNFFEDALSRKNLLTADQAISCFEDGIIAGKLKALSWSNGIGDFFKSTADVLFVSAVDKNLYNSYKGLLRVSVANAYVFDNRSSVIGAASLKIYLEEGIRRANEGAGSGGSGKSVVQVDTALMELPAPKVEPKSPFKDIGSVSWANEGIISLYKKGFISGYEDGTFRPDNNVTREEFVKMAVGVFGLYKVDFEVSDSFFRDVTSDLWSYSYICSAYNAGIVYGNDGNYFNPFEYISRQDMSVVLYRILDKRKETDNDSQNSDLFLDDEEIADYAKSAIYHLHRLGIVDGIGNNRFAPNNLATRAQAAKMIYEISKYILGE